MAYYVDVILPIPVNQKFTYIISKDEYDFIKPGMRIIVPFGKSNRGIKSADAHIQRMRSYRDRAQQIDKQVVAQHTGV